MRYVLDSCVALKWVLPEADSALATSLRDDFNNSVHELIAPDVFPIEIAHALTRAERQGRISAPESGTKLADVLTNSPTLHSSLLLLIRATEISSALQVGVYDCLYVALAEQENCELVTADDKMLRNLQTQFPFIVSLSSLP